EGAGRGAVDGQLTEAEPVSVRVLSHQRALVGDAPAAQQVLDGLARPTPSFDPVPLHDAVPAGAVWLVAQRPTDVFAQAAARLAAHDAPWARRTVEQILAALARRPESMALVDALALSLDVGEPLTLRLRAGCPDDRAATRVAWLLRAALWQQQFAHRLPADARRAAADTEVRRVGRQVEATLSYPLEYVRALASRGGRGAP
ncbi:MAG: hypothetical protein JXR83_13595, partial [Deltaproteobacteria bacterium]|nr:hypothetical protein [Deltaproteobacteria bacterium]